MSCCNRRETLALPKYTINKEGDIYFDLFTREYCDCCGGISTEIEHLLLRTGTIPDSIFNIQLNAKCDKYIKQQLSDWNDANLNSSAPLPDKYILSISDLHLECDHNGTTWDNLWDDVIEIMSRDAHRTGYMRTNTILEALSYHGEKHGIPVYEVCYGT